MKYADCFDSATLAIQGNSFGILEKPKFKITKTVITLFSSEFDEKSFFKNIEWFNSENELVASSLGVAYSVGDVLNGTFDGKPLKPSNCLYKKVIGEVVFKFPDGSENTVKEPSENRVRRLRQAKNLTQAQLANACGLPYQWVQKIENGTTSLPNASAKNIVALAKALGMTVEDLLT